ncbi:MAG: hypothetical protein V1792_26480 [Pseudomonadota bacterium]
MVRTEAMAKESALSLHMLQKIISVTLQKLREGFSRYDCGCPPAIGRV